MVEQDDKLASLVTRMQNQERMVRQKALREFLDFCQEENNLSSENAVEIFDFAYLVLIKCYGDRFEMCRSLACMIITELLKHLQQNDYYLSLLMPVIANRLAPTQEVVEDSEEMRLQLLQQVTFIVNKYKDLNVTGAVRQMKEGEDRLLKPYNDIIDIIKACLMDSYPAILKESCEVIKITAIASPSFHYRAEALAEPLITLLKHRHSNIRIAAIEALGVTALHIHSNLDKVRKIVKDISPLLMDTVPFVRRECGRVGCLFLMELRDRYSLFENILPLVLCCLTDEIEDVREEIEKLWIQAGDLYYEENQTELQNFALIEEIPDDYPKTIPKRPTVGCRALVRKALRVLNAVLHEMEDWKEDVRLHSTKLLMQIVIHSEDYLATKYFDINAVLCKTCQDQEAPVAKLALHVASLIGYFVDQKTWSKYAFEELKTRQSKLGVIRCINALYESSRDENRFGNLHELSIILLDTSISHSDKLQTDLFKLLRILSHGITPDNDDLAKNFYMVALKATSMAYDTQETRSEGMEILKLITEKCAPPNENLSSMHAKYLKATVDTLDLLDKANNESFEQVRILYGIICICGFEKPFVDVLKSAITTVLDHAEGEAKIKILSAIAIASLNWDKTIGVDDPTEKFLILKFFVEDCIMKHLIWHAGRTAESVRTMATAALCSIVQGTSEENASKIVASIMIPLVSLIDDNSIGTRTYALKIFMYAGALKYDQLKAVASSLWSRLNDPGNEVRVRAATCLGRLKLIESDLEEFGDMWDSLLKQVLKTMLLHLESPEIDLRNALISSISELAKANSSIYKEALNESTISSELKSKLPASL